MKKLLLATVAAGSLALTAPAQAEIALEVGGYFKGYGTFVEGDSDSEDAFDIIRDTEIHFGGETTLDNGLTIGAHFEFDADSGDSFTTDESYVYFSGNWGRVNFGEEDGAVYLLQVAAPSADSNIDGLRQYVNPFGTSDVDYDLDPAKDADKFTYLSPIVNGFQVGASYTSTNNAAGSFGADTETDSIFEFAGRYEGQFDNVGVIAGAGYAAGEDDYDGFNVALDLDIAAFGIGAAYVNEETDTTDTETDTIVVGVDYTTGPFKLGASYINVDNEVGTTDTETDRYTAGVVYNYGPGMSFRGSVSYQDVEVGSADTDATAVTLGTQINF